MKFYISIILVLILFSGCKSKKESSEFFKRGNYHFKKNELDKAEHFFSESIKKNPEFADAYNNRGVVYQTLGKLEKAITDFEKAVALDGGFVDAKFNLAKIYSETGNYREAEIIFKNLEPKLENSSDFYNYFAQNTIRLNHWNDGKSLLMQSLKINKSNIEALTNLAYVYLMENDFENSEKLLNQALKINPEFGFALNNLAVLKGRQRKFTEGVDYLKKALEKEPNNLIFINNLTLFLLENKDSENALEFLKKSERLNDKDPFYLRNKAIFDYMSGDFTVSEKRFLEIEKNNPEVDYLYYYLYRIYSQIGKKNEACKFLKLGKNIKDAWCMEVKSGC